MISWAYCIFGRTYKITFKSMTHRELNLYMYVYWVLTNCWILTTFSYGLYVQPLHFTHKIIWFQFLYDDTCPQSGNLQGSPLTNELQEQETILKQCIDQLRNVEATRASLIAHLKEGLQEQVPNLTYIMFTL